MINGLIEVFQINKYAHHFVVIKLGRFIRRKTIKHVCICKRIFPKANCSIRVYFAKSVIANRTIVQWDIDIATPLFDCSFYGYDTRRCSEIVFYIFFVSTRNSVRRSIPPIDDDSPFSSLNWKVNMAPTPFRNEQCRSSRNTRIIRLLVSRIASVNTLPTNARCTRGIFNYATCFPMLAAVFVCVGFARAFEDMIIGMTCKRTHAV